jgi:benzoyl-CoA reductase/2-hydroxyglutaryl-CoA dehydratase subunit BcrC/BadD/HgdB
VTPEQIREENKEQRAIQFKNFAALTGLSDEVVENGIRSQFSKPWHKLKASQKRGRLLSEQFLRSYNKSPIGEVAYQRVVWRSLIMPTEFFYAMNLMPFTVEMAAAQLAISNLAIGRLETAECNGFSQDLCSFIKTGAGAVLENIFPSPDVIITTSHLCDPAAKFAAFIAQKYKRPEFVIDIPYGMWSLDSDQKQLDESVDYVAGQLKEMVRFITNNTGAELDTEELSRVIKQTNEARYWLKLGNDLAHSSKTGIMRGSKDLNYATNLTQTWGTKEIVDVYKERFAELEAAARAKQYLSDKPRVLWSHLRPYYDNNLLAYIEEKANIVDSQVNYVFWDELDPRDPFRSIARKAMLHPAYCPLKKRIELTIERRPKGDGIIAFYPKSCRHFHSCARMEEETARAAGIPMLVIDGDCIDNRGDDFLVQKTRIDRFLKDLRPPE